MMAKPDILIVDGRGFSWQHLCELRRQQLEDWKKSEARLQPITGHAQNGQRQASIGNRACWMAGSLDRDPLPLFGHLTHDQADFCRGSLLSHGGGEADRVAQPPPWRFQDSGQTTAN
jgi:hypothetical protein